MFWIGQAKPAKARFVGVPIHFLKFKFFVFDRVFENSNWWSFVFWIVVFWG